jgi:hypothetical protein
VAVADVPAVAEVAAGVSAGAEVTEAWDANVDGVGVAEGTGLDVFAGALAGVLVAALDSATGVGSSCGWLPDVAAIDMGAAGGSSERSWRDNSGSAVSSYAGAEGVEATGVEATGVGAGGTSRSNEVADSNGSKGSADSSSKEESVKPGLVATRATKAARALVLPVVDKAAEAFEDAGARAAWADAPAVTDVIGAEEVADPLDAPDAGDAASVGELPGFAGRGGAFAAGGGEAAGAGRAGGTVGIAALGVGLGAVAVAANVEVPAADVAGVAGDAAGRRASEGVFAADSVDAGEPAADEVDVAAGRVASAARAIGMVGLPALAGRDGAVDADAADTDAADAVAGAADAVVAPRVAPEAEPVGTAPVLAEGAGARGAVPAAVGCGEVDFDGAALLEVGCVASAAVAVADLRAVAAAADDADVVAADDTVAGVAVAADEAVVGADAGPGPEAGAADKVGGIGASPDPRSEASNIGDAHVPEYALSVNVDAGCEALVEPLELLDGVASAAGVAIVLDAFVAAAVLETLAAGEEAREPVVAASDVDGPDALVERAAESVDERPGAFAVVGLDACPEVAGETGRMPNPAGVLGVTTAAGALVPAGF